MKKTFLLFLVALILSSCRQNQKSVAKDHDLTFKVLLNPSFDEEAEIVLVKNDSGQRIRFLILDRQIDDRPEDTFYLKTISLSKMQFLSFDSLIIQKTKIVQPHQWTGCCDGMPVSYSLIHDIDTSILDFRSPNIDKPDSSGYNITKATIDYLKILYNDSLIADYINDVESYMDQSKQHIKRSDKKVINRLREIEYSR